MIRQIRALVAGRLFLAIRWWLTEKRAHKLMNFDGVDHHLGVGTFRGGYISKDPHTGFPDGLIMYWLPEGSLGLADFEKIELRAMRKHPTLNEVIFYVPC